jgi:hypothetical protein
MKPNHISSGRAVASEQSVLLLQRTERSYISDSKSHEELSLIAQSHIDAAVFSTEAAAIGVISDLRRFVEKLILPDIISYTARRAPATVLRIAKTHGEMVLVGIGR